MNEIHLFADGSYLDEPTYDAHVGCVVFYEQQILAEAYHKFSHIYKPVHEEIAMICGIHLLNTMGHFDTIHIYSDSKKLISKLTHANWLSLDAYQKKIFLMLSRLRKNSKVHIHWIKDDWSYGLKRAHHISRIWKSPITVAENKKIATFDLTKNSLELVNHYDFNSQHYFKKEKLLDRKKRKGCVAPQYGRKKK
jgi:ribonuclease HI